MAGPRAPVDLNTRTTDPDLASLSDEPAALVSGRYWHHLRQVQPAGEATDPEFQGQLISKLGELTAVVLPQA
jgi:hypothetical protein